LRKGEHTRQEIIRKAAPIFNQRGYDGAALSDLMKATGLEKGGIYRHFDSKEQLAAEAFDYALEETLLARIHDLDGVSNTVDRLKQLLANFVERRGVIPGGCPLLNIDTDDGNSVLRARVRLYVPGAPTLFRSSVRNKAREIRPRVDADRLATLIISALEGAVMVYRLERTEESLRAMQAHLDNYLEKEVRGPQQSNDTIRDRISIANHSDQFSGASLERLVSPRAGVCVYINLARARWFLNII
jgi:TetR/AcrR family transcriptional repressor of nem operon